VPALPLSLLNPVWVEFAALLPQRPEFDPTHPLGCHRRRIPDQVVFEHVIDALVHGSGYERIATTRCSDRTIRRRLRDWAEAGIAQKIHALALAAYDRMIGLQLQDLAVDGAITKAPCGGERAGRSPVDRGKGGLKRSTQVEGDGIPLGVVSAPANRHDSPLLEPTITAAAAQVGPMPDDATMHLDRAYDNNPTRRLLDELELRGEIARKGVPAPIQVGKRWVVERTNSWMNGYGKIRRCTDRDAKIVDFYLYLAAALVTIRQLIRRARTLYRWDTRPTTRRLK
jgi:transposase